MTNKNETQFTKLLKESGLNLPTVVDTLDEQLAASKEHLTLLAGVMDAKTRLKQKIKILEMELFTELLKKQTQ